MTDGAMADCEADFDTQIAVSDLRPTIFAAGSRSCPEPGFGGFGPSARRSPIRCSGNPG